MNFVARGRSGELIRGGVVCQPGLACTNGAADGRKSFFPSEIFPGHRRGVPASGSSDRRPMPHMGSKGLASAKSLVPMLRRYCFVAGFCENLVKEPARTASSRTLSQIALSKLHAPRSMRLCARESGDDRMSSSVRRSSEKSSLFRHHKVLHAGIRRVVHDKRR